MLQDGLHDEVEHCIEDDGGRGIFDQRQAEDAKGGRADGLLTCVDLILLSCDDLILLEVGLYRGREVGSEANHGGLQGLDLAVVGCHLVGHCFQFGHDGVDRGVHCGGGDGGTGWTVRYCLFSLGGLCGH